MLFPKYIEPVLKGESKSFSFIRMYVEIHRFVLHAYINCVATYKYAYCMFKLTTNSGIICLATSICP